MPKKGESLGKDVLNKATKSLTPSKVELTIKPPSPIDMIRVKATWEKNNGRELSEAELIELMAKYQLRKKEQKYKMPTKSMKIT